MPRGNPTHWTLKAVKDRCDELGDCWLWQQGTNGQGYPLASMGGKPMLVRRWVYQNSPALFSTANRLLRRGYVVTSSCGDRLCCNPEHLTAITYGEKLRRNYAEGYRSTQREYRKRLERFCKSDLGKNVKLNFEIAREIRLDIHSSHMELGRKYGVHPKTIADIRAGRYWKDPHAANSSVFQLAATGSLKTK